MHAHFHFIGIKFEPRDIWLGVYWDPSTEAGTRIIMFYVCIVPMLPIMFSIEHKEK